MTCAQYSDFLDRYQLQTQKLFKKGYGIPRLKSSLQKLYDRHLVKRYEISISHKANWSFAFYADKWNVLIIYEILY